MNDTATPDPVTENGTATGTTQRMPGMCLRSLREKQGISQSEVARSLHLTVHYVNALEKDEYHKLPGKIFVKGYFKSYAVLLGADEESILQSFEALCTLRDDYKPAGATTQARKARNISRVWMLAAAVIIVLGLILSWWFLGTSRDQQNADYLIVPDYLDAAVSRSRGEPQNNRAPVIAREITVQSEITADAMIEADAISADGPQEEIEETVPQENPDEELDQRSASLSPAITLSALILES